LGRNFRHYFKNKKKSFGAQFGADLGARVGAHFGQDLGFLWETVAVVILADIRTGQARQSSIF